MKKIIFTAINKRALAVSTPPTPAIKNMPEWFKKLKRHIEPNKTHIMTGPDHWVNLTVKSCIPFLDAISLGYMITLPCDIVAVDPELYGGKRIIWDVGWEVIGTHSYSQIDGFSIPENFEMTPYKFFNDWSISVPKGYSILITNPLNSIDSPFFTMSGVIDSDSYNNPINLPFFLKKNFYGTIKKGTPIAQVIPFKRDSWKSEISKNTQENLYLYDKLKTIIEKSYKIQFWKRKTFS